MKSIRNASFALTGAQSDKISEFKTSGVREVIIITNLNAAGGAACFIAVGSEAVANRGIQLLAGQSITMSRDSGYIPPQDAVFAYAAAAGTTLAIYEEITGV
jgi:hypothetical protein